MIAYDYKCQVCGFVFEELVAPLNRDKVSCPLCGAWDKEVVREMPAPRFVIHGYSTANGYASHNRFGDGHDEDIIPEV